MQALIIVVIIVSINYGISGQMPASNGLNTGYTRLNFVYHIWKGQLGPFGPLWMTRRAKKWPFFGNACLDLAHGTTQHTGCSFNWPPSPLKITSFSW